MSCTLEERLALILLELSENFGVPDGKAVRLTLPARHRTWPSEPAPRGPESPNI
jgi:hypothetical protein